MIRSITAKVDNKIITFTTSNGKDWYVSSVSPNIAGVYPVELTFTDDTGTKYVLTSDDVRFGEFLTLYVSKHKSRLIRFLPEFLREVEEFKVLFAAEDFEVDILYPAIESIFAEAMIMYCSEERILQWEKALGIVPQGTLEERRYYIKGILSGIGKLNEAKIKAIVKAFTGGGALVSFSNSVINVRVLPPDNGELFRFPDVERTLIPLMPAHLSLKVERFYSTWGDVKNNYSSWEAVKQSADWSAIKNWMAP